MPHEAHDHVFGQDAVRSGERRSLIVIVVTLAMMAVEIGAGIWTGSMALLADGLHMASHATALGIAFAAYVYARRHARDRRFSFGTGKMNALGGFTGAVLLAVFTLMMAFESAHRLIQPVAISFNQAIVVAVIGLLVNAVCAAILGHHDHDHDHDHEDEEEHGHPHEHEHHHDHNLRAAYLHVLADALTSVTAIAALAAGKYLDWVWMDPLMGMVGSVVVARWSWGLLKTTSGVLLDRQASEELVKRITAGLETEPGVRVLDVHVWSIGPGIHAAILSLSAGNPRRPEEYKAMLPRDLGLVHVTIEIHAANVVDASSR